MIRGPEEFASAFDVSRETMERLKIYDDLLLRWNAKINLVGPSTIPQRWSRHFADSAQLLRHIPKTARTLVDLGAGAGFPGLVLAAFSGAGGLNIHVSLVESDIRKTVFLQTVAREMGVDVTIEAGRIEQVSSGPQDVIVSRALAPIQKLLHYAARFAGPGSICLFHKGANLESELTEARLHWHIRSERHPSSVDPDSGILEIREFELLHGR